MENDDTKPSIIHPHPMAYEAIFWEAVVPLLDPEWVEEYNNREI
jgi:hypothetical protein